MALIEGKQMVTVAKLRLLETRIEVEEMKKKMMAVRFGGANGDNFLI